MEAVAFTGGVLLVAVHCREHGHDPLLCWARLVWGSSNFHPSMAGIVFLHFQLFVDFIYKSDLIQCMSSSWSPGPLHFFQPPTHTTSTTTTDISSLTARLGRLSATFFGMHGIWTSFFCRVVLLTHPAPQDVLSLLQRVTSAFQNPAPRMILKKFLVVSLVKKYFPLMAEILHQLIWYGFCLCMACFKMFATSHSFCWLRRVVN